MAMEPIASAADPAPPPGPVPEPGFGPGSEALVYSVEALQGDDPEGERLTGLRVSGGRWFEDEVYGRTFLWGALQQGEDQNVASGGGEVAIGAPLGPFRLMPRFRLGFEHRSDPPHDGFAALAGIGIELNFWMGRHLQLAVSADRDFGFPSGTRDLTGVALRWAYVTKSVRIRDAAENGDLEAVRRLLQDGARMETLTAHEALYGAAQRCDHAMMVTILDAWRGPADHMTELSLRTSVRHCETDIVRLLLERGADPNANYYLGGTTLMDAADAGKTEAARLLIASGANVNGRGRYERGSSIIEEGCRATALMLAAEHGNPEMMALLLDAGADPAFRDSFGCTAEEAARRAGHPEIADSIRRRAVSGGVGP